jgi:nitrite reductase/ring-hydroxylating ferredoxin subunit
MISKYIYTPNGGGDPEVVELCQECFDKLYLPDDNAIRCYGHDVCFDGVIEWKYEDYVECDHCGKEFSRIDGEVTEVTP